MDNQQKDQIEDITGNIPLFLNIFLESDCKNFEDALDNLNQQLTSKIHDPMTNFSDTIPEGRQELYGKMEVFADIKWISCIEKFKNNPSVKGFFVEKACIASILKNGIMANGKCMLYLPRWNQEAIDGLLISQTNNKLYVAPIEVTLDKSGHSDSEVKFFSSIWPNLKSNLPGFEDGLEIIFIWITSESDTDVTVEIKSRKIRNKSFEINPDYIRVVMGFRNVSRDINRYLS
ncbi:7266_t:CDS:2, partial [Acaulospora colombiana]